MNHPTGPMGGSRPSWVGRVLYGAVVVGTCIVFGVVAFVAHHVRSALHDPNIELTLERSELVDANGTCQWQMDLHVDNGESEIAHLRTVQLNRISDDGLMIESDVRPLNGLMQPGTSEMISYVLEVDDCGDRAEPPGDQTVSVGFQMDGDDRTLYTWTYSRLT